MTVDRLPTGEMLSQFVDASTLQWLVIRFLSTITLNFRFPHFRELRTGRWSMTFRRQHECAPESKPGPTTMSNYANAAAWVTGEWLRNRLGELSQQRWRNREGLSRRVMKFDHVHCLYLSPPTHDSSIRLYSTMGACRFRNVPSKNRESTATAIIDTMPQRSAIWRSFEDRDQS